MGTGQGKLPLDVVTDNALRKRKYEQEELEGAQPLMVTTLSDGELVNTFLDGSLTVLPKYRKFNGFSPCIVASLVAGATYGQSGTLVTVSASPHGMTAALNGRAFFWPGSVAIAAGFYPNYQYVDANTFTFSNPAAQTVASGSSLTPALPFTSSVKIASRKIYGNSISATGKIEVDFTSVADNSAGLKSLQVKISGAQCGLQQVGSTPNISGRISICADASTSKQIAVSGADGNVSSSAYKTAIDLSVDQTLEVFLQMAGASQFRSVVSLLAREVA